MKETSECAATAEKVNPALSSKETPDHKTEWTLKMSQNSTVKLPKTKYISPAMSRVRGSVSYSPRPRRLSTLKIALILMAIEAAALALAIFVLSRIIR